MSLNFESPKIPLMTLSGITSLTDVLHELPLPLPHPDAEDYSLLAYSSIPIPAIKHISCHDEAKNVSNVLEALQKTNSDNIVLKNQTQDTDCLNSLNVPPLLQAILSQKPDLFHKNKPFSSDVFGNIKYNSPTQAMTPQSPAVSYKGLPLSQASPGECASQISSSMVKLDRNPVIRNATPHSTWQEQSGNGANSNEFTVENSQSAAEENPKICLKIRRKKKSTREKASQDSSHVDGHPKGNDVCYDIIPTSEKQETVSVTPGSLKLKLSRVKTEVSCDRPLINTFEVSSTNTQSHESDDPITTDPRIHSHAQVPSACEKAQIIQTGKDFVPSLNMVMSGHSKDLVSQTLATGIPQPADLSLGDHQTQPPTTSASNLKQCLKGSEKSSRTPLAKPRKKNQRHVRVKFVADQEEADIHKLSDILYPDDSEVSSFDELRSGMMVVAKWPQNGKMYEALVIDPLQTTGRRFRERKPQKVSLGKHGVKDGKASVDSVGLPHVLLEPLQLPEDFDAGDCDTFSADSEFVAYHSMADRIKLKRQQKLGAVDSGLKRRRSESLLEDSSRALITMHSDDEEKVAPVQKNQSKLDKKKVERRRTAEIRMNREIGGMTAGSLRRFTTVVELILEDINMLDSEVLCDREVDSIPESLLIPASRLKELNSESAKLKVIGSLTQAPVESITRLLAILEPNIRSAIKEDPLVFKVLSQKDGTSQEQKLRQEVSFEKVFGAMHAALTALNIMTSPGMPKAVFIEDVIDAIIQLIRFQLENTIYPEYDTVYKIHNKSKVIAANIYGSSSKQKRAHYKGTKSKAVAHLYAKMISLLSLCAELLEIQPLTDTSVLLVSSMAISPFFVENVRELQLTAIRLTTTVFARYERHRKIILEDIFQSLARLPTSKRNLRSFRLNCVSDDNSDDEEQTEVPPYIQMLSALILQMMQAIVTLPLIEPPELGDDKDCSKYKVDELRVIRSYDSALRTGQSFLAVFLKKCASRSEEIDYRPLFENFIHDLLATVNKPEWPASEMMLSLLGRLLVHTFSVKQTEASLRTASIDYLGVITAKLRRDAISSHFDKNIVERMIVDFYGRMDGELEKAAFNDNSETRAEAQMKTTEKNFEKKSSLEHRLHVILLNYIKSNADADPALLFAQNFYIGQWLHDIARTTSELRTAGTKALSSDLNSDAGNIEMRCSRLRECESQESAILDLAVDVSREQRDFSSVHGSIRHNLIKRRTMNASSQLTYENATLITRYLASSRPFYHSFDTYLTHILRIREEASVAVRTRAIKCLAEVIAVDPAIFARKDIWRGVQASLVDTSTSVREAAVDLVGRFILLKPDLVPQYYNMLTARILDTGVSVRKRVIKILRDLCHEHPSLPQLTDACVKMIRRVNDEEGIKKLVHEVFMKMWFTPLKDKDTHSMRLKAQSIADVVAANRDIGYEWIEQMMFDLIDAEVVDEKVEVACQQIVNCLANHLIQIEQESEVTRIHPAEKRGISLPMDSDVFKHNSPKIDGESSSEKATAQQSDDISLQKKGEAVNNARDAQGMIAASMRTLVLFAKIRPRLLVPHVMTLQPHLTTKCETTDELHTLQSVCRILELAVPHLEHPGEAFLASLEEDLMKLILREKFVVVKSAIACLGSVTKHITQNYKLVWDCFQKLAAFLNGMMSLHSETGVSRKFHLKASQLLRTLYITGHLMKTFDFDEEVIKGSVQICIKDKVYDCIYYFTQLKNHEELRLFAVGALGLLMLQDPNMMFWVKTKECYNQLLAVKEEPDALKKQVLMNLQTYLSEEDSKMQAAAKVSSHKKKDEISLTGLLASRQFKINQSRQDESEDIKEICEESSGMASSVMQVYLKKVLDCFFHRNMQVRCAALNTIYLTLSQGLVHPLQCVPFIIAISTDPNTPICSKAELLLIEMNKRYSGFIHAKSLQGIKMAHRLQQTISVEKGVTRGRGISRHLEENTLCIKASCSQLYTLIRGDRKHRRSLMLGLLNLFDDTMKTDLGFLLFIADNLAYFPYVTQDEPLFVMSQIEIYVSVSGSNVLQSFRESWRKLSPKNNRNIQTSLEQEHHSRKEHNISSPNPFESTDTQSEDDYSSNDEDETGIVTRFPDSDEPILEFVESSMACLLLLRVKEHLKILYGFTDSKIHHYSSSEHMKVNDKQVVKKRPDQKFEPKQVCEYLEQKALGALPECPSKDEEFKQMIATQYLEFNGLMTKLDPNDVDTDSDNESPPRKNVKPLHPLSDIKSGVADIQSMPSAIEDDSDGDSDAGVAQKPTALDVMRKLGISKPKGKKKRSSDHRGGESAVSSKELRARKKTVQYVETSDSDDSEFFGF